VFVGGPVSNDNLFYIHTLGEMVRGSIKVKDELYWGGDFEELKLLITTGKAKSDQVKFFVGYSGWSPGQLDDEIAENSWLVTEADIKHIMKSNQNFWLESVKNAGGHYKTWRNFPEDPNAN
jgi:putative transcriptional regulator